MIIGVFIIIFLISYNVVIINIIIISRRETGNERVLLECMLLL